MARLSEKPDWPTITWPVLLTILLDDGPGQWTASTAGRLIHIHNWATGQSGLFHLVPGQPEAQWTR